MLAFLKFNDFRIVYLKHYYLAFSLGWAHDRQANVCKTFNLIILALKGQHINSRGQRPRYDD
jgi:hypothetical protein